MAILVTGAAGYIGSVVVEELVRAGHEVIAFDNMSQGHPEAVPKGAVSVEGDLSHRQALDDLLSRYQVEAVMHLAADSLVELSLKEPGRFFRNNVANGINLLEAMLSHGVKKMVFSSTAAVYGEPTSVPIPEAAPARPVNPYGESKLMFENILHWYGQAHGLKFASLRYFNAAGATPSHGEDHEPETHLIPIVLKVALGLQEQVDIFGTDYDTKDGSCVRDYIHVADIAQAHILALEGLERMGNRTYNLGNGNGYSVLEIIAAARKVTGMSIPARRSGRRAGDPARLVASSDLIRLELGWQPKYPDLGSIIESAWEWQRRHPQGYGKGKVQRKEHRS